MPCMSSQKEVDKILDIMKKAIKSDDYTFIPRDDNMRSLRRFGLTIRDFEDYMAGLTYADYRSGPEKDHKYLSEPPSVWKFKKIICSEVFYIKFRIIEKQRKDFIIILSFHETKFP